MPPKQYWGPVTSTLNWCELDYEVSPFIAEFWNTISNLAIIVPPIFAIFQIVLKLGLEKKFILTNLSLVAVGIGSWAFHMTLQWTSQLYDELPMVYGSTILLYQMLEVRKNPKKGINWLTMIFCFCYCFFFTAIYLIFKKPIIHNSFYGILVIALLLLDLRLVNINQCSHCTKLLKWAFFLYFLGFGLWNIDNQLCPQLTELRTNTPYKSVKVLSQLHAWWHIFTGYSAYLHILFGMHARGHFLKPKTRTTIKYFGVSLVKELKEYE